MNTSLTLTKLLLCAGILTVGSALASVANAGVNRCVDAQGGVLFTDADCPQGSRVANDEVSVSDSGSAGIILNSGVERIVPVAQVSAGLPRSRWAVLPRPLVRKTAGTDALTLQSARASLQMQDELRRQRRVASR